MQVADKPSYASSAQSVFAIHCIPNRETPSATNSYILQRRVKLRRPGDRYDYQMIVIITLVPHGFRKPRDESAGGRILQDFRHESCEEPCGTNVILVYSNASGCICLLGGSSPGHCIKDMLVAFLVSSIPHWCCSTQTARRKTRDEDAAEKRCNPALYSRVPWTTLPSVPCHHVENHAKS